MPSRVPSPVKNVSSLSYKRVLYIKFVIGEDVPTSIPRVKHVYMQVKKETHLKIISKFILFNSIVIRKFNDKMIVFWSISNH